MVEVLECRHNGVEKLFIAQINRRQKTKSNLHQKEEKKKKLFPCHLTLISLVRMPTFFGVMVDVLDECYVLGHF